MLWARWMSGSGTLVPSASTSDTAGHGTELRVRGQLGWTTSASYTCHDRAWESRSFTRANPDGTPNQHTACPPRALTRTWQRARAVTRGEEPAEPRLSVIPLRAAGAPEPPLQGRAD